MLVKQKQLLMVGLVMINISLQGSDPKPFKGDQSFFGQVLAKVAEPATERSSETPKRPDTPRTTFADFLKKLPGELPNDAQEIVEQEMLLDARFCPPLVIPLDLEHLNELAQYAAAYCEDEDAELPNTGCAKK